MQFYFDNQLVDMGGRYDSSYTRNGQATLFINKYISKTKLTFVAILLNIFFLFFVYLIKGC